MTETESSPPVREAVGVFDDAESFLAAIDELEISGFDQAEISLLAGKDTVEEKLGHVFKRVEELEDEEEAPRRAFISPDSVGDAKGWAIGGLLYIGGVSAAGAVVASGGTLLAAILALGLAGGAGGLFGTLLGQWIEESYTDDLQEQLDRGGLLLWVHLRDADHEKRALDILKRHSGHDVHVHAFQTPHPIAP
ncbi:MAG TPA: hypothetical protein VLN73_09305 [Alphaproteobacteria bacterium]|nr:hypothetical protein [Alphaproteobacteria bacterium]